MMKKPYNIVLLGWYGYNAIGDDIIAEVTKWLFYKEAGKRDIEIRFVPYNVLNNPYRRSLCIHIFKKDLIIIGGGSILGFDSMGLYNTMFGFDGLNFDFFSRNNDTPMIIFGGRIQKGKRYHP